MKIEIKRNFNTNNKYLFDLFIDNKFSESFDTQNKANSKRKEILKDLKDKTQRYEKYLNTITKKYINETLNNDENKSLEKDNEYKNLDNDEIFSDPENICHDTVYIDELNINNYNDDSFKNTSELIKSVTKEVNGFKTFLDKKNKKDIHKKNKIEFKKELKKKSIKDIDDNDDIYF